MVARGLLRNGWELVAFHARAWTLLEPSMGASL